MEGDDDDGFVGYVETTKNLGGGLMAAAFFGFLVAYGVVLPLLVRMKRRQQARRKAAETTFVEEEEEGHDNADAEVDVDLLILEEDHQLHSRIQQTGSSTRHNQHNNGHHHHHHRHHEGGDDHSVGSSTTQGSLIGNAVAAVLDQPRVPKNKTQRRRRRLKEKQQYEHQQQQQAMIMGGAGNNNTGASASASSSSAVTLMQGLMAPHPGSSDPVVVDPEFAPATATATATASKKQHNKNDGQEEEEDEDMFFDTTSRPDFEATLLPADKLVSSSSHNKHTNTTTRPPTHPSSPTPPQPTPQVEDLDDMGILDKLATIAAWDRDMKRIIRLALPYCTQALITGLTDTLNVAVIGKLVGTREVSAFVITNLLVELSSEFVGGIHESLASLCSQAIGANNKYLAGQYLQIATILYTIFFIPFMVFWACYMTEALLWMGFDDETARIGHQYTYILIVDLLMDGIGEAIHGLLDVGGFEKWSTLIAGTEEITAFLVILLVSLYGNPTLVTIGLLQFGIGMVFLAVNIAVIHKKKWFAPYQKGMLGNLALRVSVYCSG